MTIAALPRDPITNDPNPAGRSTDDFSDKWSLPAYNDLADFYSSHVNPIFWKLHGWIDDRINDWLQAHMFYHPGSVETIQVQSVEWFKKGEWVQVDTPWVGGMHHGGMSHPTPESDHIEVMKKVITLVQNPLPDAEVLENGSDKLFTRTITRVGKLF